MNRLLQTTSMLSILTTTLGVGLAFPTLAVNPSLSDGFLCFAGKRGGYYFATSTINDASISQKQPVNIRILQKEGAVGVGDLVIFDRTKNTVTITDLEIQRDYAPEAIPVGSGTVTYAGNNTFTGKTTTGAPLSLTLSKSYGTMTLSHAGVSYRGACH